MKVGVKVGLKVGVNVGIKVGVKVNVALGVTGTVVGAATTVGSIGCNTTPDVKVAKGVGTVGRLIVVVGDGVGDEGLMAEMSELKFGAKFGPK